MTHSAEAERRRGFPVGWVLLAVIVAALAIRTIDVLLVVFLAVILAIYLDAVSGFLQRRLDVPPSVSLPVALVLTLGALVGVVFLVAPAVASQVQDFIANLPKFLSDLDQSINRLFRSIPVLRRGVTEGSAPGLLATSLNEIFGVLRGALVPYLKGGVELIISALAIDRGVLPPTINLDHPGEGCDLDYIPNVAREARVNYVMSNSFGFGGHNASLLIGRYFPDGRA